MGASTDRDFMQIAIQQMLKSRSEHEDKVDPLVGSVLVGSDGSEIAKAYRGKFRLGDHGEFTLLKKATRGTSPRGGTVYVTLEPCFDRNQPKKGCARWIVESKIRRVVIGMEDPNPDIAGAGIAYLRKHNVQVDSFDDDLASQVLAHNQEFAHQFLKRLNPLSKPTEKQKQFGGPSFEETQAVSTASLDDLLVEAIQRYVDSAHLPYKVPSQELWNLFRQKELIVFDKQKEAEVPTVAGLVLFGATPELFLPQCRVTAEKFIGAFSSGTDPEQIAGNGEREITGPLFRIIDDLQSFFETHVGKVPQLEGARRVYVPEYPWRAIREAIVNALVHRDYQNGFNPAFQMFRDRIIIKNPGLPPPVLTLEDIQAGRVRSYRRNPTIASIATAMDYMEAKGSGIQLIRSRLKKYGLREPGFDFEGDFFVLTIYGREATPVKLRVKPEIFAKLTDRQSDLLEILDVQKTITSNQWAEIRGITRQTAAADLKRLQALELIDRNGEGRATYYVLK
jgi:ATP-dependent DNA helicase RecG